MAGFRVSDLLAEGFASLPPSTSHHAPTRATSISLCGFTVVSELRLMQETVSMMNNQSKTIRASACAVALGLLFGAAMAQGVTLTKFTGGDPGEGLDLTGTFVYGLDFRATSGANLTVGDVTFNSTTSNSPPAGVTVLAYNGALDSIATWTLGATANDNNLELVMNSGVPATIQAGPIPQPFKLSLAVTAGQTYKLQLLMFSSSGAHRPADYTIGGVTTFIDIPSDPASFPAASYVVTEEITASTSSETITVAYNPVPLGAGNASYILGLTLELIPEPTTATLLALSGLLLVMRRKS
jgi:hypothetical protein